MDKPMLSPRMSSALEIVQNRILAQYAELHSWRGVAAIYGINVRYVFDLAKHSVYPPNRDVCKRLGLPMPSATVCIVGDGDIPEGAQVIRATPCECGQWFVSNHPCRRKCFICRPYRGKKETNGN